MAYAKTTFPGGTSTTEVDSGARPAAFTGPNHATVANQLEGLLSAAVARKKAATTPPRTGRVTTGHGIPQAAVVHPRYVKLISAFGQAPAYVEAQPGQPGAVLGGYW
jgi:hypothetical protein